ncbi:PPP4R2-domain-containing protein [Mycena amicta]|nr:PPP4R2-domain-containing protein [Mycena amicta]
MSLELLQHIASTDSFDSEWSPLRDAIKHKLQQNIDLFLSTPDRPPLPPSFQPLATASGGLKLPPFPPHRTILPVPPSYMTAQEAADMKAELFTLLDQFDSAPFTIQRVCELCLEPKKHYNSVGKYLRAVEKALLVTSTHNSFPPLSESERDITIRTMVAIGAAPSVPTTPIFTPLVFLHVDARSKSRSPPPSPLVLPNAHPDPSEAKSLGLVDELDNPVPGHLSEHPVALTAVTEGDKVESLEARFVHGQEDDDMAVDDNKENART